MKSSANAGRAGRRPGRQGGFSLMELIIASVLAVIVSAMMFTVLTSQEKMSKQTESYAQLQDRLRSALQVVSHHVRMAGYGIGAKVSGTDKSSLVYSTGTLNLPSFSGLPTLFGCDGCGNYDYDPAAKADLVTGGNNGTDQIGLVYRNPGLEFQLDWIQYETLDSRTP